MKRLPTAVKLSRWPQNLVNIKATHLSHPTNVSEWPHKCSRCAVSCPWAGCERRAQPWKGYEIDIWIHTSPSRVPPPLPPTTQGLGGPWPVAKTTSVWGRDNFMMCLTRRHAFLSECAGKTGLHKRLVTLKVSLTIDGIACSLSPEILDLALNASYCVLRLKTEETRVHEKTRAH